MNLLLHFRSRTRLLQARRADEALEDAPEVGRRY